MNIETLLAKIASVPSAVKLGAVIAFAVVVLLSIGIAVFANPPRVPLFAQPLRGEQLAEVEERLAQWNVPFTASGDNVVVDARRRNDVLLRLSLGGIPHIHVATSGEALSNIGVLTPQTVVDAQTRSGLAGDIELALRSIDGVDDARVIIAPAKPAAFSDEGSADASASVRLQLRAGAHLSRASIAGIRSFVAASVTGLDPAHVTLLDDRGVALTGDDAEGDDGNGLQSSLQSALDDALGDGVAIVRVHADYVAAESEQRDIRRAPLGSVPIARDSSTEQFDGQGRRYEKNDERDDRGSDVRESVSRVPRGSLARVTTAVFVDAQKNVSIEDVRALAAATVGFDRHRGDVLTVEAVDFHHARVQAHDLWYLLYGALVPLLPTVAVVLGTLVAGRYAAPHIAALAKGYLERTTIAQMSARVAGVAPAQVRGALANEPPHAAAAIISALPAATAAAVLELYPAHEREAIVRRMQRVHSSLIPDAAEIFGHRA
jgi:flagellar biosynthesis/type III secretory pathway M-ring protein FliF/YscJ